MRELTKEILYDGQTVRALVGYLEKVKEELYNNPDFDEDFNGTDFMSDLENAAYLMRTNENINEEDV